MGTGLEYAAESMRNKLQNIQIVANNLANINTTGFKRGMTFAEILEGQQEVQTKKVTDFSEGVFLETNNPLNAALSGDVFFTVKTSEGEHLTKNGDFKIDNDGYLTTREGFKVIGQNGEINLQDELVDKSANLTITKNGEIKSDDKIITKLKISKVDNEQLLTKTEGQRFYNEEKQYTIANDNDFELYHGYLESSNTNAIIEMQHMIKLQKDYEASQKMITSIDTIMSQVKEMGKV